MTAVGIRRARHGQREVALAVTAEGLHDTFCSLAELLAMTTTEMYAALDAASATPAIDAELEPLAPVDIQEVWASGVTYERSRNARVAESDSGDAYTKIYDADRPELFLKSTAGRVPTPGTALRIRADSSWDVPEPELGLVLNAGGEVVGYLVGNDMSSRSIEAENPLYLPQAKMFDDAIGLSDTIALARGVEDPANLEIRLTIERGGEQAFSGSTSTARMHRTFTELCEYLYRELTFPDGAVLLTGTGLVPPDAFTLADGDQVEISIDQVGTLRHGIYRSVGRSGALSA